MRKSHRLTFVATLLLGVTLLLVFTSTAPQAFAATISPAKALGVQNGVNTAIFTNGTAVTVTKSFLVHVAPNFGHVAPNFSSSGGGNTIVCTATVTEGLASGYFVGQGEITCSEYVAVISNSLLVYRNGGLYGSSSQVKSGVYYIYRDVVKSCSSTKHSWQTYIAGGVTFPAGYLPQSEAVDVGTPSVTYTC